MLLFAYWPMLLTLNHLIRVVIANVSVPEIAVMLAKKAQTFNSSPAKRMNYLILFTHSLFGLKRKLLAANTGLGH